jgi:ubiquinone/menaquinone biosynthesis C-methylase UbiE
LAPHVCPWWLGWILANPLRRLLQDPSAIVAPLVRAGMTVLEPGPGVGYFTVELARAVGPIGRVVAVDLQPRMLSSLRRRVERAGLAGRVEARQAHAEGLGVEDLAGKVDLVFAFAVVHELADQARFFTEVARLLTPGGRVLVVEPAGHVGAEAFEATLRIAERAGLARAPGPVVARSRTAVLSPQAVRSSPWSPA